jgi:amidase
MRRRAFLQLTTLGGAAAVVNPALATPTSATASLARARRVKPSELDEMTIAELQTGIASRRFTAASLARRYLARIEEIDRRGPALNSAIELNPDALALAEALDKERKANGPRGPLHGVPILVKDNLDTHDRMHTSAGSLALAESVPPQDSFVVRRLREAGVVLLGKTNLSEWANFRSSHSTSGWSGRGGQTRNPYALDRNPSGSSSGSAVAVAANLCAMAVGTETDGSILSPASFNGIVGIKPTVGLVSRTGIIPIAHSQDTAGPMARTVTDAAVLLGCLAGSDPRDSLTSASAGKAHGDYTRFLDPQALRGARIGVVRKFFGTHAGVDKVMEAALAQIKRCGAALIDPAELPSHGKLEGPELEVLLYEFKAGLNTYLASLGPDAPLRTLKQVIEFNEQNRNQEMPFFGQDLFLKAEAKGALTEKTYLDALAACRRLARDEGIDAVMNQHNLDALVAPTTGPAHVTDLILGDHGLGDSTTPAAVAGYPSITVPAGQVFGLPVGLSFFGRAWSEPRLISLAFAFEQATKMRKPPGFRATAALA